MKRIDSHCHIYPDAIAARAVAGTASFYDLPLVYRGTLSDLRTVHDAVGITNGVIFSVATVPHQAESINRFIADAAGNSDGRFVGLGTVHPDSPTLKEDIDTILSLGLRGVKLHPDIQRVRVDSPKCLKIYELCEGRLPLLVHTGDSRYDYSNPNRIIPILDIYKNLTFIGAHFGGWSIWEEATEKLKGYENFYVDCSSSLYAISSETAGKLIREYGADRVLFGTDYPMWDPEEEVERFLKIDLTEEERSDIFYNNAAKLFSIK